MLAQHCLQGDLDILDKVATEPGLGDLSPRPGWKEDALIVVNRFNQWADSVALS